MLSRRSVFSATRLYARNLSSIPSERTAPGNDRRIEARVRLFRRTLADCHQAALGHQGTFVLTIKKTLEWPINFDNGHSQTGLSDLLIGHCSDSRHEQDADGCPLVAQLWTCALRRKL